MNRPLSARLMRVHPDAPWAGPHTPPQQGDETLPAREWETGILWHYHGPIPATIRACSSEPWGWEPDLDDGATVGLLMSTVRAVYGAARPWWEWRAEEEGASPIGWVLHVDEHRRVYTGATELVEALVVAIEEAAIVGGAS